jgi:single-strand DNA-binding protein
VAVTSFTIAVDRKYSKDSEKKADFITIVAWRQTAEFICKYFTKGSAIIICGELQTRSWKDADGKNRYATEVVASEVSFAEAKNASANISITAEEIPTQGNVGGHASEDFEVIDDDLGLPF